VIAATRQRAPAGSRALALAPVRELTLAALVLVGLGVFHVWSRTRVLAAGYALGELHKEHAELVAAQDQLRIELEYLRSPAELERSVRARLSKLGMAPPDRGAVLAAGPGRLWDGPGRAGVDGVGHPPRPAEPARSTKRAAAGPAAAPGERLALRGPLRAGRAPPREK
jgi:hypothetical protein